MLNLKLDNLPSAATKERTGCAATDRLHTASLNKMFETTRASRVKADAAVKPPVPSGGAHGKSALTTLSTSLFGNRAGPGSASGPCTACNTIGSSTALATTRYAAVSATVFDEVGDAPTFASGGQRIFFHVLVARVCLAILFVATVLSGIAASSAATPKHRFSCALSCAVCATATLHYLAILGIRNQVLAQLLGAAYRNTAESDEVAQLRGSFGSVQHERNLQEVMVDSLRHTDWAVTLPLLGVEMAYLLDGMPSVKAKGGVPLSWGAIAALLVAVVVLGAIYRFGFSELREDQPIAANVGPCARLARQPGRWLGVLAWIGSGACFAVVLWAILSACSHADRADAGVADAVRVFVWWWVAYPIVSVVCAFALYAGRVSIQEPYPEALSLFKDVSFGVADVASKAAFAYYVAKRALTA